MKKFKEYLSEMTMSYNQDSFLSMQDFSNAKHIGDLGYRKILYKQINGLDFYAITEENPNKLPDHNNPVCWLQVQNQNVLGKDYLQLRNIFTEKEFRGKNYGKNLLFFLRNVEEKSFIFGDTQSELGQLFVRSVAKSGRFPMFWINVKTGEKHEYDFEKDNKNIKPYRSSLEPTDWQIISEGLYGKSFLSRFQGEMGVDPNYWNKFHVWF
jgi:hypothetical protein